MSIADNYGDEDDDNVGDDDDGDGDDVVIRKLCPVLEKCKDDKGNLHRLGDTYIGESTIYSNFKYVPLISFAGVDGCSPCKCTWRTWRGSGGISSCMKYFFFVIFIG